MSHWHDESFCLGKFFLVSVKGEELFQPEMFGGREVYDVHGAVTIFHGVGGREALGNAVNVRPCHSLQGQAACFDIRCEHANHPLPLRF